MKSFIKYIFSDWVLVAALLFGVVIGTIAWFDHAEVVTYFCICIILFALIMAYMTRSHEG